LPVIHHYPTTLYFFVEEMLPWHLLSIFEAELLPLRAATEKMGVVTQLGVVSQNRPGYHKWAWSPKVGAVKMCMSLQNCWGLLFTPQLAKKVQFLYSAQQDCTCVCTM
jgi:hypothetical protein